MKTLLKKILPKPLASGLGAITGRIRAFYLRLFRRDYSQLGETVAVRNLLRNHPERTFVEIGANDGVTVSTTYGLVLDGWTGVSVEANPRIYEKLRHNLAAFPKIITVCCAASPTAGPVKLFFGKNDPAGLLSTISMEDSSYLREVRDDSSFVEIEGLPLTDILEKKTACPPDSAFCWWMRKAWIWKSYLRSISRLIAHA